MNKGTYGYPLPPNSPTRIAPPEWKNYKLIAATTSNEVVPQNVYQMLVMVWGGGSLGGGGFAMGIVDVVPGQTLPTITVGGQGGSSSFGALVSATGSSGTAGGSGSVVAGLRGAFTASGGTGVGDGGGGGSGSPYGKGGNGGYQGGGGGWGGNGGSTNGGGG